jgi:DNA-binding FadR family transcriptional regulator
VEKRCTRDANLIESDFSQLSLSRKKLAELVEAELEKWIRRPGIEEGKKLPSERELMAIFKVGRPSVREALASLKRKGLVQIGNGERARVRRPSADTVISQLSGIAQDFLTQPKGIAHFEQLRQFFESSLVRYAAERATDEQICRLEAALARNSEALDDNEYFVRTDVGFHRVIAEIPGNPIFLAVHVALLDWLIAARAPTLEKDLLHRHNNNSYQQHVEIFNAIKQRNPDAAENALKEHLRSVYAAYFRQGGTE